MHSYRSYVVRRVLWGVAIFVVLCYAFSATIYGYLEVVLKEQLRGAAAEMARDMPGVTSANIADKMAEAYQQLLHAHSMDGPILVRIHRMAVRLISFDFGRAGHGITTVMGRTQDRTNRVMPIVFEASAVTACLFGGAYLVQLALGYLVGLRSAARRRPGKVTMIMGISMQGMSVITLSLLAVFVFSYCFRFHPTDPWVIRFPATYGESFGAWLLDLVHHFWLPFVVLVFGTFWQTAYSIEKLSAGTTAEEYVEAARARGTPERKIRLGLIPRANAPALVTLAFQGLFVTLWGSFIVERVFSVPGIGSLFILALHTNERFLAAAILVSVTLVFQVCLILLDVSYGFLDPRIRVGARANLMR